MGYAVGLPELVDVSLQFRAGHPGVSDEEIAHPTHEVDVVGVVGIDLGAVAGGDDDRLGDIFGQLRQGVGELITLHAQPLAHLHRRGPVVKT